MKSTSAKIAPFMFEEALKILKEAEQKKKYNEEQTPRLIALLANTVGWNTFLVKYLPKGQVFIGTGTDELGTFKYKPSNQPTPQRD